MAASLSRSGGRRGCCSPARANLSELLAAQSLFPRRNLTEAPRGISAEPGESCSITWLRQTQTTLPPVGLVIKKLFLPG